jgi:DNA-binding HxlR family transcriptional regulator
LILFHLLDGSLRSGLLQKKISVSTSNKMFANRKEIEKTALLPESFAVVPPKVEYRAREGRSARKYFT